MDDMLIARAPGLLEAEVDGELVALHVDRGTCYGFNRTATRIWALLEAPRTRAELRDALMTEFAVDGATCDRELGELLDELARDGLIEFDEMPAPSAR